jgi:polyribonucleotide nucleotidyltransferase
LFRALKAKEGADFLPLSVDYQEKFASTGKVPGGFLKRESRLSDYEILISRLTDRAIRPLFPDDYHAETQVMIYLISGDRGRFAGFSGRLCRIRCAFGFRHSFQRPDI